jgi:proline iminopeptidase
MPYASINGTELFYTTVGQGEPCLVMHGGLGFDHTMVHPGLDRLGETFQLVYYDHRGNGRSGRPPIETLAWEQLAHDAEGLRRHLGVGTIAIAAHSLGAYPALEYALRYPQWINRLILIGAVPAFDFFPEVIANMKERGASDDVVALLDFSQVTSDEVCKEHFHRLAPLYFHRPTNRLIEQALGRVQFCAEASRATPSLIAAYTLEPRLKDIHAPTLVLAGADDFVTPVSQVVRLRDGIPNATMAVFEQSGHLPYLEEPDEFFRVVRKWIGTHP